MRIRYAVPVLLTGVLAACGGSSGSAAPPSSPTVSSSPSRTLVEVTGPAVSPAVASPTVPLGDAAAAPAPTGALGAEVLAEHIRDAVSAKRSVTMKAVTAGATVTGVMKIGKPTDLSLTSAVAGQQIRILVVKDQVYVATGQKVGGKTWFTVDPAGQDARSQQLRPLMASLQQQTEVAPAKGALKGVTALARKGPAVDGVATVSYTVKLNSKQLVASLPAQLRTAQAPALAGASAVTTFLVDADWVPRKVVTVTTVKGTKTTVTVTYTRWGAPVTIEAPPAADVAPASAT